MSTTTGYTAQTINVTGGYPEYTWPATMTDRDGKDISGDAVAISLGTFSTPGTWTAGVLTRPTISSVKIKLFVDNTVTPGTYWVWVKVTDSPEIPARKFHRLIVV